MIVIPPPDPGAAPPDDSAWKRVAWFFGIAYGSLLVVAGIAYLLKALLR